MKFTSAAIAALLVASSSAVLLQKDAKAKDDCGGKWCNKGLAYDLDEATLRKAEADNVAKTQHYESAKLAKENADADHKAAVAAASATAEAETAAASKKACETMTAVVDDALEDYRLKTVLRSFVLNLTPDQYELG